MSQSFGFTPSKNIGFREELPPKQDYQMEENMPREREKSPPQYKEHKMDLQSQIQYSTQKIDPRALSPLHIYLSVSGTIESGDCGGDESLQVKYDILSGRDWTVLAGKKSGLSQVGSPSLLQSRDIVWNFPFDCVFMATNPMGWPQIIVTLYGPDLFGRSVIKGYGSAHFPTSPGYHERTIHLYKPLPMSWLSGMIGYLMGTVAEYQNPEKTVGYGEGREVTRVKSSGKLIIKFQVMERNMKIFGYST